MSLVMQTRSATRRPTTRPPGRFTRIGHPSFLSYVEPVIKDSVNRLAATAGDAIRLDVAAVESKSMAAIGSIPGVAILAISAANGKGTGRIRSNGTLISWRAPGSTVYGTPVNCPVDGLYLLADGQYEDKTARVQVFVNYLSTDPTEASIYIQTRYNNALAHDDVLAAEAAAGDVTDYTVTVRNTSLASIIDVRVWIREGPQILIGSDGLAWYAPTFETHPDAVTWPVIEPDATQTLHVRRTVEAAHQPRASISNVLEFSWLGI